MGVDPRQLNSLTLAYIGDAIYELYIRKYLVECGVVKPDHLHHQAIGYVAADKQAAVLHRWLKLDLLSEEEKSVVRRGRNAKSQSTPKNMSISDYRHATAFEALLGFHHLMESTDRLTFLIQKALDVINHDIKYNNRRDKT